MRRSLPSPAAMSVREPPLRGGFPNGRTCIGLYCIFFVPPGLHIDPGGQDGHADKIIFSLKGIKAFKKMLLRVDYKGSQFESQLLEWLDQFDKACGVFEQPSEDNPHYHFYFESELKPDSIRKSFKRKFPDLNGNKDFGFTVDEPNFLYMAKGPGAISKLKDPRYPGKKLEPIVKLDKGDFLNDIKSLHEKWWLEAQEWSDKKRPEKDNFIGQIESAFLEWHKDLRIEDPLEPGSFVDIKVSPYELVEWIYDYLTAQSKWSQCDKYNVSKLTNYFAWKYPAIVKDYQNRNLKDSIIKQTLQQLNM